MPCPKERSGANTRNLGAGKKNISASTSDAFCLTRRLTVFKYEKDFLSWYGSILTINAMAQIPWYHHTPPGVTEESHREERTHNLFFSKCYVTTL